MWRIREAAFFSSLIVLSFACVPLFAHSQEEYALLTSEAIVEQTNLERRAASLPKYRDNDMLATAAEEKARDMATRSYFSHATPEGEKTWNLVRENGYAFSRVGENLAVKFSDPARVVSLWLASPGHRANLLNEKFVDIGVGIAEGVYQGATTTFVVALYATPLTPAKEAIGEVKGEQESSQESAGLLASVEPEREQEVVPVERIMETVAAENTPTQQAAVAAVGRFELFRIASINLLHALWGFFRW